MKLRRGLLLCLGLLLLAGCASGSSPFTDDFSDPASGWGAASTESYVRGYDSGRYLIRIDVPHWFVWTTLDRNHKDVAVEVLANSEGSNDNHYGVICRYSSKGFYYFAVSADGYYAVFRRLEDQPLEPLTGPAMLRSPVIHRDGSVNRLLGVCQGTTLTFYVNGELVARLEDTELTGGAMGFAAGTVEYGQTTLVWFDDFKASKP